MFFLIPILIGLIGGAWLGLFLAGRGVTADNALVKHQKKVYWIGSIVLAFATFLSIVAIAGQRSPWLPSILLLYIGAYNWDFALFLCSFCMGMFVCLELRGWRDRKRLQQLILFLVVGISATIFLIFQIFPIANLVQTPIILDGVVLQTTPYSCSAAAIATLARRLKPELTITEKDVVELAGTSRQGTSTLAEIRTLEKLGLNPQYERNLTLEQLANRDRLAVLHVMEPVNGAKIAHAIALLSIDPVKRTLTIGNPLYGKQVKTFAQMNDYWLEEAVFVKI